MLNLLSRFKGKRNQNKIDSKKAIIESHPILGEKIASSKFFFQQDIVEEIRTHQNRKIPTQDSMDLSSTVCAGTCYWTALSLLGINPPPIANFIEEIYQENNGIKHPHGVDHIKFIKYLGERYPSFYGLSVNPFREHTPSKYISYGGYSGEDAELFFRRVYRKIKDTTSMAKLIISEGGLALTSIQATFNGYSPDFHDILIVGYREETDSFIFLDPDARVFFDTEKTKPKEVQPVAGFRGLYAVSSEYLNKNTYRTKPSPGGIVIGLFKSS